MKVPLANAEYWDGKFTRIVERDQPALRRLEETEWSVLTLWESELSNDTKITQELSQFLTRAT